MRPTRRMGAEKAGWRNQREGFGAVAWGGGLWWRPFEGYSFGESI